MHLLARSIRFCALMLRERPFEFQVAPDFDEIDEGRYQLLLQNAWRTFLASLYSSDDTRLDQLHRLGLETDKLKDCFEKFVTYPDVDEWPHQVPPEIDIANLQLEVNRYIDHIRKIETTFPDNRGNDKLMNRLCEISRKATFSNFRVIGQFFDLLELFESKKTITQKCWTSNEEAKAELARFDNFREQHIVPALNWWRQYRYEFVIQLLQQAQTVFDRERRASGGLDFQDLLLRTAEGLKTQPHLRQYFQRRYTHILVDEFQDTDPIQAQILTFLTSENQQEQNWMACNPRDGSLFLVGDPKQSIYRFRRADIVTYKQVKKIFQQSGGEIVTLSTNFRSTQPLIDWNNDLFGQMFGYQESVYSPAAVDMERGRNDSVNGELPSIQTLSIPDGMRKIEAIDWEADSIARYIHNVIVEKVPVARTEAELERGLPNHLQPGDFLIVAYNKKHLHVYADALDAYGINNEVTGSNAFANIEELAFMRDCLIAIDDPKNPVAYVSVLRSELFGFGDADLFTIKQHKGFLAYTAPVPESLPLSLHDRVTDVNRRLLQYRNWLRRLPFPSAFAMIASDLGLIARCGNSAKGSVIMGGFSKCIEWVRSQNREFDSTHDLISYLDDLMSASETDSCSVLPQSGSSVRIMNLHKAKGLESPVVFLANTFGYWGGKSNSFVDRSSDVTRGYLSITKPKGIHHRIPIAAPAGWEAFSREESAFQKAERTRLLYVACTRAGCHLVVSVASSANEKRSHWKSLHDYVCGFPELKAISTRKKWKSNAVQPPKISISETKQLIANRWLQSQRPTYEVVSAKKLAFRESAARPTWHATGEYGNAWGSAIHLLLEIEMNHPKQKLDLLAIEIANRFDLGSSRVAEMIATVQAVAASDIWHRASSAKRIFTEIPFEGCDSILQSDSNGDDAQLASAQRDANTKMIPTITRGVIDLCFKEANGWVIVDYKTDDITSVDLPSAIAFYQRQLKLYGRFWNSITREPVIETGIYFTKLNQYSLCNNEKI